MNELENANLTDKKDDDDKDIDPEMIASHIACTVRILDKIHAKDKDSQELKMGLNRFLDIWQTFNESIMDNTNTYQAFMKLNHKKKENIILYCEKKMREEELEAEKRSIELLNDLKSKKKHKYRDLDGAEDR